MQGNPGQTDGVVDGDPIARAMNLAKGAETRLTGALVRRALTVNAANRSEVMDDFFRVWSDFGETVYCGLIPLLEEAGRGDESPSVARQMLVDVVRSTAKRTPAHIWTAFFGEQTSQERFNIELAIGDAVFARVDSLPARTDPASATKCIDPSQPNAATPRARYVIHPSSLEEVRPPGHADYMFADEIGISASTLRNILDGKPITDKKLDDVSRYWRAKKKIQGANRIPYSNVE